jgi:phenol 2-monooxygenase
LDIEEVKWFSIFKIQEKIASDWVGADGRVILVGDSCHTHSPGGGLGMQAGKHLFRVDAIPCFEL